MNELPREFEERYGAARGLVLPVTVSQQQLDMLRAAENEANKGWNVLLLIFAGSKILAHGEPGTKKLRLPEFRLSADTLDLEDFEAALKSQVLIEYDFEIDLSRYLMLAQCTFMSNSPVEGDESDTSSRTLHLFTARALNSDEVSAREALVNTAQLVKPAALSEALQAEWADVRAQLNTGGSPGGDMRGDYEASWAFVRARLIAQAFQHLFDWPLPEL